MTVGYPLQKYMIFIGFQKQKIYWTTSRGVAVGHGTNLLCPNHESLRLHLPLFPLSLLFSPSTHSSPPVTARRRAQPLPSVPPTPHAGGLVPPLPFLPPPPHAGGVAAPLPSYPSSDSGRFLQLGALYSGRFLHPPRRQCCSVARLPPFRFSPPVPVAL